MGIEVWTHVYGTPDALDERAVSRSLARAGVDTRPLDGKRPTGAGILLFDRVDRDLCRFLREVSDHGRARVLALGPARSALSAESAWTLLDAGVSDVLVWDDDPRGTSSRIASRLERWHAVDSLLDSPLVTRNIIGGSTAWRSALRQIVEIARFSDAYVLLLGETGTGKELVARLIHTLDAREGKGDLVVLDCTTVVPELSGSEFFGHERGAFTGAASSREGAFAMSHGGTLFLDEIGELPARLQAQLLRVVQEHAYKRVGGNKWQQTDFRLICATNRDLPEIVARGGFRSDLFYRVATWVFRLPPLRERSADILALARHFLAEDSPEGDSIELEAPVSEYLLQRAYPGNVRELKHLMTRIAQRHVGRGPISVGDLPEGDRPAAGNGVADWRDARFDDVIRRAIALGGGLKDIGQHASETAIRIAVDDEDGNLQRAARKLGVTDRALQLRRASRRD